MANGAITRPGGLRGLSDPMMSCHVKQFLLNRRLLFEQKSFLRMSVYIEIGNLVSFGKDFPNVFDLSIWLLLETQINLFKLMDI